MSAPGLLFVLGECGTEASVEEFNDWYDNEHGPARLTVPGFNNAVRYKASDSKTPSWLIEAPSWPYDGLGRLGDADNAQGAKCNDSKEIQGREHYGTDTDADAFFGIELGSICTTTSRLYSERSSQRGNVNVPRHVANNSYPQCCASVAIKPDPVKGEAKAIGFS